jgi:hypothetical protein
MKQLTLAFLFLVIPKIISAQCYIQYGYDASGNRTSRTYIGGCGKPAPGVNVDQAQLMDQSDTIGMDGQTVSQTVEDNVINYHLYPNPTYGLINLDVSNPTLKGVNYMIYDPNGTLVKSAAILSSRNILDISGLMPGSYILIVIDDVGRHLYTTQIVKM